ncbi:MAG TPA: membrane protein insertase YidC [Bacteroidales bacterium]|nr:membrane protein insertase YidC [Bacteroidales bacterium]
MDKNTITGLILIFLIFIGFSIFNSSRLNKEFEKAVSAAETELNKGNLENARTGYINALRFKPNQPDVIEKLNELNVKLGTIPGASVQTVDSVKEEAALRETAPVTTEIAAEDETRYGVFSSAAKGSDDFITLENDKINLKIALKGGRVYSATVKDYTTHDSLPLILFSGDSTVFGFNFFTADNKAVQTNNLYFTPVSDTKEYRVTTDPRDVVLRLQAGDDRYIEYKYTLEPGKYSVGFNVTFRNMTGILPANQNSIELDWRMYVPQQEKGRQNEEMYTTIKYKYYQDDVDGFRLRSNKEIEKVDITTKLSWIAYVDQFFSSVLITDNFFLNGSLTSTKTITSEKYIRYYTSAVGIPIENSAETSLGLRFYYGPNHISTLRKEGHDLDQIIFLGKNIVGWINRFLIIPVFNWMEKFIGNYGIIILILTILLKIILFPLTFKSYQSTAKMQILKPQVEELAKKYPKQEDAMKKQQATMDLYKRAGVNPMGGCLPMLLQFPILFAMFRFFPVSIELRQEPFLWTTDLSTYDSILTLPFKIPWYGSHVSLWTLLMTISSILTTKMSGTTASSNQPGMKVMMYMMPVMFMFMFNNFSSGLTYYYFLANMLSWLQNIISKRLINTEKVLKTLEENKKKPLPKSKWQQRLEQAAKQRGINPPKR